MAVIPRIDPHRERHPRERRRRERLRMVRTLVERRGVRDARVLDAMRQVERHEFLDPELQPRAYGPHVLPIGYDQTTPHPYSVGLMAAALGLRGSERVLEIGTGSGYQTALLSSLASYVCSLERLPQLAAAAGARLQQLGYGNAEVRVGTHLSWDGETRFDAIHVSAAVPEVPGRLLQQLANEGRLVLPVGREPYQRLLLLHRRGREVRTRNLGACQFPPIDGSAPHEAAVAAGQKTNDRL